MTEGIKFILRKDHENDEKLDQNVVSTKKLKINHDWSDRGTTSAIEFKPTEVREMKPSNLEVNPSNSLSPITSYTNSDTTRRSECVKEVEINQC